MMVAGKPGVKVVDMFVRASATLLRSEFPSLALSNHLDSFPLRPLSPNPLEASPTSSSPRSRSFSTGDRQVSCRSTLFRF